jgi:hypothetical protein
VSEARVRADTQQLTSCSDSVDNPGGPLLPSGEQLYELVRDRDGDGWAIQEARIPTVQPGWQNFTLSAWYR